MFKLLTPKNRTDKMTVSISEDQAHFSPDLVPVLKGKYVEVYVDYEKKLIAFKPTDDKSNAYTFTGQHNVRSSFFANVPKGRYPAQWVKDRYIVKVEEIAKQ